MVRVLLFIDINYLEIGLLALPDRFNVELMLRLSVIKLTFTFPVKSCSGEMMRSPFAFNLPASSVKLLNW